VPDRDDVARRDGFRARPPLRDQQVGQQDQQEKKADETGYRLPGLLPSGEKQQQ
jgi:hypothetical protein